MKKVNVVLGTMTFGESVFAPDVSNFISAFLDKGYEELDTAYVYNEGNCEKLLGDALLDLNRPFRIATKVNPRITGKLDSNAAFSQVNESLKRMKLDSVDIAYLHFPDPKTPFEYVLSAMNDLHVQGKIKELGLSNFPAWMVAEVWSICDKNGWIKPTVFEGIYNPLTRKAEVELDDCLNYFGLRFYAYNPLCGGLLTGRYGKYEETPNKGRFNYRPNYKGRYWKKSYFEAVNLIKEVSESHGITPIEATYRWLSHHSMLNGNRGDSIIIGASKLNHLIQNMEAIKAGPLSQEVIDVFENAWTIVKGDSPEYFTIYNGKGSVGGEKK